MGAGRAVFLDRDGTLVEEIEYLTRTQDMRILPGAFQAVTRINESGRLAVVVTNQSAVARGLLSEEAVRELHEVLSAAFAREGARIDAFYYCPHHPEAGGEPYRRACRCRKPSPGLLLQAARELDLDLAASHMIGDKLLDVEAGHRAGCTSLLVRTGYGRQTWDRLRQNGSVDPLCRPDFVADGVLQAVEWILKGGS